MAMQMELDGKTVTIGGIAKGSGMIHINMGTMLSFVTTDALFLRICCVRLCVRLLRTVTIW